ncbi:MAG: hypothetical protein ACXW02_08370 [Halobacteriota archaeon]
MIEMRENSAIINLSDLIFSVENPEKVVDVIKDYVAAEVSHELERVSDLKKALSAIVEKTSPIPEQNG